MKVKVIIKIEWEERGLQERNEFYYNYYKL